MHAFIQIFVETLGDVDVLCHRHAWALVTAIFCMVASNPAESISICMILTRYYLVEFKIKAPIICWSAISRQRLIGLITWPKAWLSAFTCYWFSFCTNAMLISFTPDCFACLILSNTLGPSSPTEYKSHFIAFTWLNLCATDLIDQMIHLFPSISRLLPSSSQMWSERLGYTADGCDPRSC